MLGPFPEPQSIMVRDRISIRGTRAAAVCALIAGCALASMAATTQNSAADSKSQTSTATKKPAAKKTTATRTHASSTTSSTKKPLRKTATGKRSTHKKPVRARGQQKIDNDRAQEIQEALIREHYMTGEATGTWNAASEEAMRRYQADHGWQSKTVPDARALIKLGLGPSKDHLLNPESAMTTVPDPPKAETVPATSHSAPATSDPAPAVSQPSQPASDSSSPQ